MKNVPLGLMVFFLLLGGLMVGPAAGKPSAQEAAKIEYLIFAVETLEGAKFLRNGREYDARTAADHLRLKLRGAGNQVKTAEDFIRLCGSRSSLTGEAYRIRFADGTALSAEAFFRNKLKAFPANKP